MKSSLQLCAKAEVVWSRRPFVGRREQIRYSTKRAYTGAVMRTSCKTVREVSNAVSRRAREQEPWIQINCTTSGTFSRSLRCRPRGRAQEIRNRLDSAVLSLHQPLGMIWLASFPTS